MKRVFLFSLFCVFSFSLMALWMMPSDMKMDVPLPIEKEYVKNEWLPYLDFNLTALYYFSGLSPLYNLTGNANELYLSVKDKLYTVKDHKIVKEENIPYGACATYGRRGEIFYIKDNWLYRKYHQNTEKICAVPEKSLIAGYGRNIFIVNDNGVYRLIRNKLKKVKDKKMFPAIKRGGKIIWNDLDKGIYGTVLLDDTLKIVGKRSGLYYKVKDSMTPDTMLFPPASEFCLYNKKLAVKDIDGNLYSMEGDKIDDNKYESVDHLTIKGDTVFVNDGYFVMPMIKDAVLWDNKVILLLWDGKVFEKEGDFYKQLKGNLSVYSLRRLKEWYWYYPVITDEGEKIINSIWSIVSSTPEKEKDEVYYTLSYLPFRVLQAMYRLNSLNIVRENADLIYSLADTLKYVNIKEEGNFTTLVYEDSLLLPDSLYYSTVVFPMVLHEIPAYIDTVKLKHAANVLADSSNYYEGQGVFWREYFIHDKTYGKSFFDIAVKCDNVDSVVHRVHRFTNKKEGFMQFGYRTVDVQPVIIYLRHYGSCGEHSALSTAILRSLLIPVWPVGSHGEDHVWAEYWKNGWHHWDLAFDEEEAFDNPQREDMGGKGVTIVYATTTPGHIIDRTDYYRKCDTINILNSEERVYILSNWNNSESMAYWTDRINPVIYTGFQKKGIFVESDGIRYYYMPDSGKKVTLDLNDKKDYEKVFTLDRDPITSSFSKGSYLRDTIGYTGTEWILFDKYADIPLRFENTKWNVKYLSQKDTFNFEDKLLFETVKDTIGEEYPFVYVGDRKFYPLFSLDLSALQCGYGNYKLKYGNKTKDIVINYSPHIKNIVVKQDNPDDPLSAKLVLGPYHIEKGKVYIEVKPNNGNSGNDVDLFLYKDDGDGILSKKDKRVASSTTPTDREKILKDVEEGDYFIILHGWKIKDYDDIDLWFVIEGKIRR